MTLTLLLLAAWTGCASPPSLHHRVTVPDPTGLPFEALLVGGYVDGAGVLRDARLQIRDSAGGLVWDGDEPGLEDPWLLRAGRFAGRDVLFVGVRRATIFDRAERPRPFLYALLPGGAGLERVWLGTSLSRPFACADFGNLDGAGEDELVALEHTREGALALGAYRWEGFGVEGMARSDEIPGAVEVRCGPVLLEDRDAAVVWAAQGETWQFTAFRLEHGSLTPAARMTTVVRGGGVSWQLVPPGGNTPGAVRMQRGAFSRTIPFQPLAPNG